MVRRPPLASAVGPCAPWRAWRLAPPSARARPGCRPQPPPDSPIPLSLPIQAGPCSASAASRSPPSWPLPWRRNEWRSPSREVGGVLPLRGGAARREERGGALFGMGGPPLLGAGERRRKSKELAEHMLLAASGWVSWFSSCARACARRTIPATRSVSVPCDRPKCHEVDV